MYWYCAKRQWGNARDVPHVWGRRNKLWPRDDNDKDKVYDDIDDNNNNEANSISTTSGSNTDNTKNNYVNNINNNNNENNFRENTYIRVIYARL